MDSDTTDQPDVSIGCSFLIEWVIVDAIALALASGIMLANARMPYFICSLLLLVGTGAIVGKAQSMPLSQYIQVDGWVWSSLAGWAIGLFLGSILGGKVGGVSGEILVWGMVGISLGIVQTFVLSDQIYWSGWWILINILGFVLGTLIGILIGNIGGLMTDINGWIVVTIAIMSIVHGTLTGLFLFWTLRRTL